MQCVLLHHEFIIPASYKVSSSSSSAPDLTLLPIMARWLSPLSLSKRQAQLLLALGAPLILLRGCNFFNSFAYRAFKRDLSTTSLRGVFHSSKWVKLLMRFMRSHFLFMMFGQVHRQLSLHCIDYVVENCRDDLTRAPNLELNYINQMISKEQSWDWAGKLK